MADNYSSSSDDDEVPFNDIQRRLFAARGLEIEIDPSITFESVGQSNTDALLGAYDSFPTPEEYLRDDDVFVSLHSTHVTDPSLLKFHHDVDGVVLEVKEFRHLQVRVADLHFPDADHRVKPHWVFLKKHLNRSQYSHGVFRNWHHVHGVDMGVTDGGFHLNVTLVPEDKQVPCVTLPRKEEALGATRQFIRAVMETFSNRMYGLSRSDLARPTVQANDLTQVNWHSHGRVNVKPTDSSWVLGLFDDAVRDTPLPAGTRLMKSLIQMGQKIPAPLRIDRLTDRTPLSLSVHVAVNVKAKDPAVHLMWSRFGVETVTHDSGSTFTALGMHEAVNYQSEVDHGVDIDPLLSGVLAGTPTVSFVQLYVDAPHNKQVSVAFI